MAFPIKFLSLQKSELEYEVAIRGSNPESTVQELRKQIAKLAPIFPSEDILDSPFGTAEDLVGVSNVLTKIKSSIEGTELDRNNVLRVKNLLNHLYHRLNRIHSSGTESAIYGSCVDQFKMYTNKVQSLKDKDIIDPLLCQGTSESSISTTPMNISVTCDRSSQDIIKLKYDGKTCVRSFVQRAIEFKQARNISDNKLLSFATEIFTGDALHWFRSNRDLISDWDSLLVLLKNDFDRSDYDYRLLSEIRSRTQGESENIVIYLSIMSGLFSRLSKTLSEDSKLEIILHNIRPCYSTILASSPEIKSIDELRSLCTNFEKVQARLLHFREPPAPSSDTLAPEFAYSKSKAKFNQNYNFFNKFNNKNAHNNTDNQNYNHNNRTYTYNNNKNFNNHSENQLKQNHKFIHAIDTPKRRYCPRCRTDSHGLRQCTADKSNIFCFVCGKKDVKTPQCPDCNKAKGIKSVQKN
ncbi:bromodomain-containing protein DDB_G0270170-like [Plodia interpunctella]|uniref:bromodomain-containing protein DDB_G0270170-like n=1 Tax=Plodia interpunctella TaxID=58824 RepID=UPI002368C5EE|nr:bromodomain-containing protein DDB_G0270170-like [Plodia interpunctella]XP_053608019.1 bromodomain-containing protein DDB_G0270170-like [Plodia interpunctella]XP_053621479.1 bromodomain-containing protein DDB_G0270170-like [Plodia interpunctella]